MNAQESIKENAETLKQIKRNELNAADRALIGVLVDYARCEHTNTLNACARLQVKQRCQNCKNYRVLHSASQLLLRMSMGSN